MMKKFLILVLVCAQSVTALQARGFGDVASNAWFSAYVTRLGEAGIVSTENEYFYPNRSITRAELAKMVVKAAQQVGVAAVPMLTQKKVFCDVATHDWAHEFVVVLKNVGVTGVQTTSCSLGKNFLPNQSVTRAEALKMLFLVFDLPATGSSTFRDVAKGAWYSSYIHAATNLRVVNGYSDGTFRPNAFLTRAEMSKVVSNVMDMALGNDPVDAPSPSPTPSPAPTPTPSTPASTSTFPSLRQVTVTAAQGEEGLRSAINAAQPGDEILLAAGTYRLTRQLWIDKQGTAASPIVIRSKDGHLSAKITGSPEEGINIGEGAAYIILDGLEVFGMGNNVLHIQDAHHITVQNVSAHSAGSDGDVLKVNQAHHVNVINNTFQRPGARPGCPSENCWQEVLDFVDTDDSVIRGNVMSDFGNLAGYVKGGSTNVLIENNTIQNQRSGAGDPAWGIGGWTDRDLLRGRQYEANSVIFRNNILRNNSYGALGIYDANNVTISDNQFIGNKNMLIEFRAGNAPSEKSNNVTIENNTFSDNISNSLCRLSSHGLTGLLIRNNNGGTSFSTATTCS